MGDLEPTQISPRADGRIAVSSLSKEAEDASSTPLLSWLLYGVGGLLLLAAAALFLVAWSGFVADERKVFLGVVSPQIVAFTALGAGVSAAVTGALAVWLGRVLDLLTQIRDRLSDAGRPVL